MELDALMSAMDRTAANLAKLDAVWDRAKHFVPTEPARGSHTEYDDLSRTWHDLLAGLPPIDGWTVRDELPDIDALGQDYIDYMEIGEPTFAVHEAGDQPGKDLAEYRFRLNRARRRAARQRLEQLISLVERTLPQLLDGVPRDSQERLDDLKVQRFTDAISEIERLVGDTAERRGRWYDLHRHMRFGQGHDWHDIAEFDWPSVREDVEAAAFTDTDPLPVPEIDLGQAAGGTLTGTATLALPWHRLDDAGFERLLYDILRDIPEHQNVEWLTHTRAPDRGRDLSLERVLQDSTGGVRTERVIVQAKHWLRHSVGPKDLAATLAAISLWRPPLIHVLVVVTSGRFSADAVAYAEQHNAGGVAPLIELWPDSRVETLLAQRPYLAAQHGLR